MRNLVQVYLTQMRMGAQESIQYRTATYFYLIGFLVEPVVYLVVWQTVAESQGGEVAGYTAGGLAAYYIVWTLVRSMNIALAPYAWEWRIRGGLLNDQLRLPIHPFHRDVAEFAGGKFTWIILWLPVAGVLYLAFRPSLAPTLFQGAAFGIAIWGGFVVRFMLLWLLGMISFWTTRASALFE
ncbi:MAG: ABC-2 family transporter protein, partial [Acidimicrobiia bacterium]